MARAASVLLSLLLVVGILFTSATAVDTSHPSRRDLVGSLVGGVLDELAGTVNQVIGGGNGTNGTWSNTTNSDPCAEAWAGLICTNGVITGLVLPALNMVGELPDDINLLDSLTIIDMSDNNLYGVIPSLANLTQLLTLDLSENSLNGTIPSLADLTSLLTLDLSHNLLEGPIPSLDSLVSLVHLDLSYNGLSGEIPSLASLSSLITLDLSHNTLTGSIPAHLSQLTSLVHLDLSHNGLNGTIPDLSGLVNLEYLDLSNNFLEGTLLDLSNLRSLRVVNLSGNNFTLEDISYLAELTNLTILNLSDNPHLFNRSIPKNLLDGVVSLLELSLNNVGALGLLPALDLGSLTLLSLENNLLCGVVPDFQQPPVSGFNFAAGCNCFVESWCSAGVCSNFFSSLGVPCDTSRCVEATECPISATSSSGSVLQFPTNEPSFEWNHPAPEGEIGVMLHASFASLTEIDESGSVVYVEDLPGPGSYVVRSNTTTRPNGASVDEISFTATLSNGAEISVAYYISAQSDFVQTWGDVDVPVPRDTLKYTFNARAWPFSDANNRLRLQMNLESEPQALSMDEDAQGESSTVTLGVDGSSASINIGLYNQTLVYSNSSSVLDPSGSFRWAPVSFNLSADLRSVVVDFPAFDATEVLSYDPSLGVLFGEDTRNSESSSDSSTWIVAVAVAIPAALGAVAVAAVAIFGVAWWRKRSYVRRSLQFRGSMINISADDGAV